MLITWFYKAVHSKCVAAEAIQQCFASVHINAVLFKIKISYVMM